MMLIPAPGSDEARHYGCTCPMAENNFGERSPMPPDGWYLDTDCFIHLPPAICAFDDE
jgi:hypothetical protein